MQARVTDGSEHRDFAAAKEIMGCELSFGPERPVEIITQAAHRRTPRGSKRALVVAASIVITILISSFFVPFLSFALAKLPLVGTSYQHMIISTRLDTAYRAGLVRELNRSVTSDGFTLTVKTAYSDPRVSIVIIRLTSDDQAALRQLGTLGNRPKVKLYGAFGWERHCYVTSYTYNEDEGALYGCLRAESTPWWSGGSWTVEVASMPDTALRIKVPVQRIFGEFMVPRVKLGQTITFRDLRVRLKNMVFYPTATELNYREINHVPKWELKSGGRTWGDETRGETEPKGTTFYPIYYPDIPDDLVLRLKGYEVSLPMITLLAVQGSKDDSLGTSVLVKEITDTKEGLKVVFESVDPNYWVDSCWFYRADGEFVEIPYMNTSHEAPGMTTKLFPLTIADIQGCTMNVFVTQFIEADEDISIKIGSSGK